MPDDARPHRKMRGRPFLIVALFVFAAAMIAILAWGDFLRPSKSEGDLNTEQSGGRTLKPQSF